MRRSLLIAALVALILVDLSLVPMALLMIFIGGTISFAGHTGVFLPMTLFSVAIGGGLIWLTIIVAKAVGRTERTSSIQRD